MFKIRFQNAWFGIGSSSGNSLRLRAPATVHHIWRAEHFSVLGTMLQAFASMMSFLPNDGFGDPPTEGRHDERNIHDENRSAETHVPTAIPEVRLYRKVSGQESRLTYLGHALMENRNGFTVA